MERAPGLQGEQSSQRAGRRARIRDSKNRRSTGAEDATTIGTGSAALHSSVCIVAAHPLVLLVFAYFASLLSVSRGSAEPAPSESSPISV